MSPEYPGYLVIALKYRVPKVQSPVSVVAKSTVVRKTMNASTAVEPCRKLGMPIELFAPSNRKMGRLFMPVEAYAGCDDGSFWVPELPLPDSSVHFETRLLPSLITP